MWIKIAFVNEQDEIIGSGFKEEAYEKGIFHRIVAIFIFNSHGDLLIQKRTSTVTAPNLWDKSAGGHVDEGEEYLQAAKRETEEELGVKDIALKEVGKFFLKEVSEGRIKNRFHMVYRAHYDWPVNFDQKYVAEIKRLMGWA